MRERVKLTGFRGAVAELECWVSLSLESELLWRLTVLLFGVGSMNFETKRERGVGRTGADL
jgi:hypothetical protein